MTVLNRTRWLIAVLAAGLLTASSATGAPGQDGEPPTVTIDDFRVLAGDDWSGALTYLNYNADHRSTIPVKLQVLEVEDRTLHYAIQYPGEAEYNAKEKIVISRDGRRIDGDVVVTRERLGDGTLVITTRGPGEDDDRPADIERVYRLAPSTFILRKNVRFEDQEPFFNRNEYAFER